MASNLDDSIPQWKKELILRKRAQSKNTSGQQLSNVVPVANASGGRVTTSPRETEGASTHVEGGVGDEATEQTDQPVQAAQSEQTAHQEQSVKSGTAKRFGASGSEPCETGFSSTKPEPNPAKMVQESVLVVHPAMNRAVTNGDCCKPPSAGDGDSDSSEELQYGPGIVSKLKSKYLSLTLRENNAKPRPSILTMRRATSLENMLDADSADEQPPEQVNGDIPSGRRATISSGGPIRRYTPRAPPARNGTPGVRTSQTRYRNTTRGNDSPKRARSVEPLVRPADPEPLITSDGSDAANRKLDNAKIPITDQKFTSGQRVNRPKRIAPIMDETERPPADHVKQTLMLFEGPATRRTRAPRPTGEVAAKVANFRNIIDHEKHSTGKKPQITAPKPLVAPRRSSPVKRPSTPDPLTISPSPPPLSPKPSPIPDISRVGEEVCDSPGLELEQNRNRSRPTLLSETPDLIIHSSPVSTTTRSVYSPTSLKSITAEFLKAELHNSHEESNQCDDTKLSKSVTSDQCAIKDKIVSIEQKLLESSDLVTKTKHVPPTKPTESKDAINQCVKDKPVPAQQNSEVKEIAVVKPQPSDNSSPKSKLGPEKPNESGVFRNKIPKDKTAPAQQKPIDLEVRESPVVKLQPSDNFSSKSKLDQERPSSDSGVFRDKTPQKPVDPESKEITKQAIENISKAGISVTYRFSDNLNKSHLPRLNTIPVRINRLVPDTPKCQPATPVKINGSTYHPPETKPPLIPPQSPTLKDYFSNSLPTFKDTQKPSQVPTSPDPTPTSSPSINPASNRTPSKTQPTRPLQNKTMLTSREIEKNSINKLKTLEQPISKVVVSMKNLDDVVVNKNILSSRSKGRGANEQTTILFNFQARDTIPDYIASDGSNNTRRGKREKPKPGESGIILLPGAPAEEFADDDEDWMLSLNGPPSPCDVFFENDNILIDGKSSISKQPKRQKMRIHFDDDATQVFEYLSEASLMEDLVPGTPPPTSSPTITGTGTGNNTTGSVGTPGHTVPSLTGSSLASYTPSKMSLTTDFQLGVTRATQPSPVVTPPSLAATGPQGASSGAPGAPEFHSPEHPITYSAETNSDILF